VDTIALQNALTLTRLAALRRSPRQQPVIIQRSKELPQKLGDPPHSPNAFAGGDVTLIIFTPLHACSRYQYVPLQSQQLEFRLNEESFIDVGMRDCPL
jgi:hypothetical protein